MISFHLRQRGVTLIELIVSIVIISIAVVGIISLMVGTSTTSADPMIRAQSLAIAQSYMDEIMMQEYTPMADSSVTGSCISGVPVNSDRAKYNDVDDYHGLVDNGAQDQNGCLIDALAGYTVTVSVNKTGLNGVAEAKRILVTVQHAGLKTSTPLAAYRTLYE